MYEVIYTGQFKRSLKLCVRRGLDVTIFTKALDIFYKKRVNSLKNISPINFRANIKVVGNVIYNLIGC